MTDIVEWLRARKATWLDAISVMEAAADEIERLRAHIRSLEVSVKSLDAEIERLNALIEQERNTRDRNDARTIRELRAEAERLEAEVKQQTTDKLVANMKLIEGEQEIERLMKKITALPYEDQEGKP